MGVLILPAYLRQLVILTTKWGSEYSLFRSSSAPWCHSGTQIPSTQPGIILFYMVRTGHYHFFAPLCRKWVWEEVQSKCFPLNQWITNSTNLSCSPCWREQRTAVITSGKYGLWAARYITKIFYSGGNAGLHSTNSAIAASAITLSTVTITQHYTIHYGTSLYTTPITCTRVDEGRVER